MSVWILTVADPEKGMKDGSAGIRFNRLTDDINLLQGYMNDIRICFIAVTFLIYCVFIAYLIHVCVSRRRRTGGGNNSRRQRPQWDFAAEPSQPTEYRNQTAPIEDLVSVRSDGQIGSAITANTTVNPPVGQPVAYLGRNHHRSAAPASFMRHGRNMDNQFSRTAAAQAAANATSLSGPNATTRLMTEEGTAVKHQIPHITTTEVSPYEQQTNGPTSVNDEDNRNSNNNGTTQQTSIHGMPTRALHHRQMNHHQHQTIVNDTTEM